MVKKVSQGQNMGVASKITYLSDRHYFHDQRWIPFHCIEHRPPSRQRELYSRLSIPFHQSEGPTWSLSWFADLCVE